MSINTQRLRERLYDGKTAFTITGYTLSILYALIIIIPLYYVFISAFKDNQQIFGAPLALPAKFDFENFIKAENVASLSRSMAISFGVTAGAEIVTILLAFPAAYAIARIRTPLAVLGEGYFSAGFLIPAFAMLVPIVVLMAQLGLLYNPLSLVLFYPAVAMTVSVMVLASYLRTVPIEIEESAEIDGASRLQILRHILFPLARPGIVTVVIINFLTFWNEYLFALVLVSQQNRTVQVALSILKGERLIDYGILSAGVLLSILPVFIVFLVFQEQVIEGLYSGSVKG